MSTFEEAREEFAKALMRSGFDWIFKNIKVSIDVENKTVVVEAAFLPDKKPEEPKKLPPLTFKILP